MQGLLLLYLRAASMPSKRKTENTPDYGRVRTELLSVSETSYKEREREWPCEHTAIRHSINHFSSLLWTTCMHTPTYV